MKRINNIWLMLLASVLSTSIYGQIDLTQKDNKRVVYPDTLTLVTDSQVEMKFAFFQMRNREQYYTNDLWKSILNAMVSAVESSEYFEGITVTYQNIKQDEEEVARIEVAPIVAISDVIIIGRESVKEKPANRIEFKIIQSKVTISFHVNDLDQIEEVKNVNIESVWSQIERKYENLGKRDIYNGTGIIKYGNANIESINSRRLTTDALELSAGLGLGFIRDRFVPDFSFKVGVQIPDRLGEKKSEVGLLYTQHVFFEQEAEGQYSQNSNSFLSGAYSRNFSGKFEVGFSVGMLIKRNGEYFQGDTFKFSLYTSRKKSGLSLAPEIIVTDSFKQAIPVIRMGFSF